MPAANEHFCGKLSISCISDRCVCLLYQPNAPHQLHIHSKDKAVACFGETIPSSGSTVCQY